MGLCFRVLAVAPLKFRQRPHLDLTHLERIKDAHCYCIGSLVGEVTTNSSAKLLVTLPNVDWFAIEVIERVDAPLEVCWFALQLGDLGVEKRFQTAAEFVGLEGQRDV